MLHHRNEKLIKNWRTRSLHYVNLTYKSKSLHHYNWPSKGLPFYVCTLHILIMDNQHNMIFSTSIRKPTNIN